MGNVERMVIVRKLPETVLADSVVLPDDHPAGESASDISTE